MQLQLARQAMRFFGWKGVVQRRRCVGNDASRVQHYRNHLGLWEMHIDQAFDKVFLVQLCAAPSDGDRAPVQQGRKG